MVRKGCERVGSSSPSLLHLYAIYIYCAILVQKHTFSTSSRMIGEDDSVVIAVPHIAITTSGRCPADPVQPSLLL